MTHLYISDAQTGESLRRLALGPADIAVADRGYCHPTAVAATVQAGAHLVVRLNPYNIPRSQPDETPLDLLQALQQQAPCTLHSLPVRVGPPAQRVPGWVHAYRLREEQANKARAVGRQRNSKKGRTPQGSPLFLAGGVLVWTSLPPDVLRAETLLQLYRVRTATWWRPWKLIQQTLLPRLTGALHWAAPRWSQGGDVMAERSRRRTLQRLPEGLVTPPSWVDSDLLPLGEEKGEEPIAA